MLSKFSDKEWAKIVAGAKCPFEFTTDRSYDDQTLYDIVAAASKVCPPPNSPPSKRAKRRAKERRAKRSKRARSEAD